ncbi:MAG: hypothetical protein V2A62_04310 [Candidatus Woesearchaeota archaeon]
MRKDLALKIILVISIAGILFSGYLSYGELFRKVCPLAGGCSNLLGLPVCVYGFIMYFLVFVVSLLGLKGKKN